MKNTSNSITKKELFQIIYDIYKIDEKIRDDHNISYEAFYIAKLMVIFGLSYEALKEDLRKLESSQSIAVEPKPDTNKRWVKDKKQESEIQSIFRHVRNSFFHANWKFSTIENECSIEFRDRDIKSGKETFLWNVKVKNLNSLLLQFLKATEENDPVAQGLSYIEA